MGRIGTSVIVVAALGWAAAEVRAEDGPTVRVAGLAPFSEEQLAEALRLRLGGDHRVEVVSGARGMTITVDGRTRSIRLGTERGAEAARVVALVAAGMVIDEAQERRRAAVPIEAHGMTADSSHAAPQIDHEDEVEPPTRPPVPPPPAWRWTLGVVEGHSVGERAAMRTGVALVYDREGAPDDGIRLMGAIGVTSSSLDLGEMAPTIRTVEVPIRVGAWLGDRFALGASAIATPYETRGGQGDRNVLLGAGIMARAQIPLRLSEGSRGGLAVLVGVDGMASAVEYRWDGDTVQTSGRVRSWLVVGVTWEGGP